MRLSASHSVAQSPVGPSEDDDVNEVSDAEPDEEADVDFSRTISSAAKGPKAAGAKPAAVRPAAGTSSGASGARGAAAAGGAAGLAGGPLAPATVTGGALSGAGIAARLNWGTASMVLEYSGMVLQGMQELNIDWQNPKVFAAAWNNQITRDAIKEKALKTSLSFF